MLEKLQIPPRSNVKGLKKISIPGISKKIPSNKGSAHTRESLHAREKEDEELRGRKRATNDLEKIVSRRLSSCALTKPCTPPRGEATRRGGGGVARERGLRARATRPRHFYIYVCIISAALCRLAQAKKIRPESIPAPIGLFFRLAIDQQPPVYSIRPYATTNKRLSYSRDMRARRASHSRAQTSLCIHTLH